MIQVKTITEGESKWKTEIDYSGTPEELMFEAIALCASVVKELSAKSGEDVGYTILNSALVNYKHENIIRREGAIDDKSGSRADLKRYRDEAKELRGIRDRIAKLHNQLYDLHSPALTGMPTAHSTEGGSSQERAADRASEELDRLRAKYKFLEAELAAKCSAVEDAIASLPSRCRTVFRAYYIDGLTWEAIAWDYHWSFSTIARIKRRGYALLCKNDIE